MPENSRQNKEDLDLIRRVCAEASQLAMRYFGHNPEVWIKPGDSPVSEADFAVDSLLKKQLLEARPDYGWISEETLDDRPPQVYKRSFIVDPIDGTRGFLDGSHYWCISVAVVENSQPIIGVLHCPVSGDVYEASINEGAFLNGNVLDKLCDNPSRKPIVSSSRPMEKKISQTFENQFKFAAYIPSLAYRIALLAKGDLDVVFVRPHCHDWDIAAADLILQECGGSLVQLNQQKVAYAKEPYSQDFLIAGKNNQIKNIIDVVHKAKLI